MNIGKLKSAAHNIADSFASGLGLMIGVYEMNVFAEAAGSDEGYITVDFLNASVSGSLASESLLKAIRMYRDALPSLLEKHGLNLAGVQSMKARFGTDVVYGPHFTVSVETTTGGRSVDRYVGVPGRRLRRAKVLISS